MFFWPARQKRAASRNRVRVIVIVDLPPQSVQARGVGYTDVSSDIQAPNNACHCLGTSADLEEVRSRRLCADKAKRYLCFRAARAVSWAALGVVLVVEERPPPPCGVPHRARTLKRACCYFTQPKKKAKPAASKKKPQKKKSDEVKDSGDSESEVRCLPRLVLVSDVLLLRLNLIICNAL